MLVSKITSNWTICSEGCTGKTLKKSKFHINGPLWRNRLMWIEMMGLTRASNSESVFMSWLDHDYGMNSLQISLFLFPWAIVKEIISISSLCALPKSIYIYIYMLFHRRSCVQSNNTSRVRFTVISHTSVRSRFYHIHIVYKSMYELLLSNELNTKKLLVVTYFSNSQFVPLRCWVLVKHAI